MNKTVIAVDIDDVLVPTGRELAGYLNRRYGSNVDAYASRKGSLKEEVARVTGRPVSEIVQAMNDFFVSDEFAEAQPETGSQDAIGRLSEKYCFKAVTARAPEFEQATRTWIGRFFPSVIGEVYFSNQLPMSDEWVDVDKTLHLRESGARYLIDDKLSHLQGLKLEGIQGILFGDFSWNQTQDLPENVVRAQDWAEVLKIMEAMVYEQN